VFLRRKIFHIGFNREISLHKKAFITGVTGQDGSYLAEMLLEKGYEVAGVIPPNFPYNLGNMEAILKDTSKPFRLYEANLTDPGRLTNLLREIRPDEVYNLAAQSDDKISFSIPEHTVEINGMGPVRLLESICQAGIKARFFQASSSEIFGAARECPKSPYGIAKAFADGMVVYYRNVRKIFATRGILFNHESPRRGEDFVTRKITRGLARILSGRQDKIHLGNLENERDWGYAPDYVRAMWLILQQKEPDDFVIATGESHSIRDFLEEAFGYVKLDYRKYVEMDEGLMRNVEIQAMRGDFSKARKILGWQPSVNFHQLVRLMVDADLKSVGQ
jgi:GDPmannose 4,6-dehydratase